MNNDSLKKIGSLSMLMLLPACGFFTTHNTELDVKDMITNADDIKAIFPKSPEEIIALTNNTIKRAQQAIDAIIAIPDDQRTFANTVQAFDTAASNFGKAHSTIVSLGMLSPDDALRDEAHKQEVVLEKASVDLFGQNKKLYEAFKAYTLGNALKERLAPEERYFVDEAMDDFKRSGLELPEKEQAQITELKKKISELSTEFEKNIAQDKSFITATQEELAGLSEDFIKNLKKDDAGLYILPTDYPTIGTVMPNARNENVRQRLQRAFSNRAYPQNMAILDEIIATRNELAKALGFSSYAALDLSSQMVEAPDNALTFLQELMIKARKKGDLEFDMLTSNLPEGVTLNKEQQIKPGDSRYITEQYRQKHYAISQEKIREYFPMESTIKALFSIYEQFFGIHFTITPLTGLWHNELELVTVHNKQGTAIGYIILDLYPRANKYSHACHIGLYPATIDKDGALIPSIGILVTNFPQATADKPSLLKFSDVTTFFHEFGHALHAVLGRTKLASQSGTSVKRDFVELPSQMLEEWLYEPEILKMVSKHYQTGESLPDETIKKLVELKRLTSGIGVLGQGIFARESLDYFMPGSTKDTQAIALQLSRDIMPFMAADPEGHSQASFGHLTGYGAKYYGYLWSKVFALDVFDAIKKGGLLNPAIGKKYVDTILSKGGSQDPNELLENFLDRKPNQEAFLKDLGL